FAQDLNRFGCLEGDVVVRLVAPAPARVDDQRVLGTPRGSKQRGDARKYARDVLRIACVVDPGEVGAVIGHRDRDSLSAANRAQTIIAPLIRLAASARLRRGEGLPKDSACTAIQRFRSF